MTALSRAFAATGTRETLHGDDWRAELADASVCSMLRLCGRKDARSSVDIRWLLVAFHRSSAEHVTNDRSRLWSSRSRIGRWTIDSGPPSVPTEGREGARAWDSAGEFCLQRQQVSAKPTTIPKPAPRSQDAVWPEP